MGFRNCYEVEKVHLKLCKLLLNKNTSTPDCKVCHELRRYTFSVNIKQRLISYWTKLLLGKETKLSLIAYRLMFDLLNKHEVNFKWLDHVKAKFDECDLSYI